MLTTTSTSTGIDGGPDVVVSLGCGGTATSDSQRVTSKADVDHRPPADEDPEDFDSVFKVVPLMVSPLEVLCAGEETIP